MRILIIGGGGREHALVWKLRQSPRVEHVWCAPGNGGIAQDAECVGVDVKEVGAIVALAERLRPDLTVVGPELPLVLGVADEFEKRGWPIVGPSRPAAELEGSKIFAKGFMGRHAIPTASAYGVYDSPGDAYSALCAVDWPVVIKADGLCGGKGVLVAPTPDAATAFIERLMEKRECGEGGNRVLLEEALEGEELSYIVLTDGRQVVPMAPVRDYKRALDGDKGPNTGGMGAYSSDDLLAPGLAQQILETIVHPTIRGLAEEGRPYRGFLYFGLMITPSGPKVLEFNCRMGDPEAQALVMRMNFDLAEVLHAAAYGIPPNIRVSWNPVASVCVVLAAEGYPGEYVTGKVIEGLAEAVAQTGVVILHAGTRREGVRFHTSGGRVLGVSSGAATLEQAREHIYYAISKIAFCGQQYRTDIGVSGRGKIHAARG